MNFTQIRTESISPKTESSGTILCANGVKTAFAVKLGRTEFEEILNREQVANLVEQYQQGSTEAKKKLPAFIFCGEPNEESEKLADERAKRGHRKKSYSRKEAMLKPTKRFIIDIDHCDPAEMYQKFIEACKALQIEPEEKVALVHITPSGKGLRVVMYGREGSTIEADQKWISEAMGVEFDPACKDISRLSFAVPFSYVIFYNPDLLFCETPEYEFNESKPRAAEDSRVVVATTAETSEAAPAADSLAAPTTAMFKGIPLTTFINMWLDGKTPDIGTRNPTLNKLAVDLAHITDYKAEVIESVLMPIALSWGKEEPMTEAEIRSTIRSACNSAANLQISNKMKQLVDSVVKSNANSQRGGNVPPPMPEKLPEMLELITSIVHDYQKPACATIIFPWLLTRVPDLLVRRADCTDAEIGLLAILAGDSGVGKGAADMLFKIINADLIEIMRDSWEKQIAWQEANKGLSAKERAPMPNDLYFPVIPPDATSAALRRILYLHDHLPVKRRAALTHTNEIESFYKLCNDGQLNICGFIKMLWDRDTLGALRFSENSSNYSGTARVNLTGSCTPRMMRKFFAKAIEDGTVGRVDICSMFKVRVEHFRYGQYTKEQKERLQWFLDNLSNYSSEHDEKGNTKPLICQQALALHDEIAAQINEHYDLFEDDAYDDYAKRANEMSFNKVITLYIANGCKWDDSFDEFYQWSFDYTMWNKTYYFGAAAKELLDKEHNFGTAVKRSPLADLPTVFTRAQAEKMCREYGVKSSTAQALSMWKHRKHITEGSEPDTFVKTDLYIQKKGA